MKYISASGFPSSVGKSYIILSCAVSVQIGDLSMAYATTVGQEVLVIPFVM